MTVKELRVENENLNNRVATLEEVCEEVRRVLGPTPPDCGCKGCKYEMQTALDAVNGVLNTSRERSRG